MDNSLRSQISWSYSFAAHYWKSLGLFLLLELVSLTFGLLFVWMSKVAIDAAVHGNSKLEVMEDLILVILCLLISFSSHLIGTWVNESSKARMLIDLQNRLIDVQMRTQWKQASDWPTGEIMVRTITDCQETVNVLGSLWITVLVTFLRITSAVALLWWLDSTLTLMLLIIIPLVLISKTYVNKLRRLNKELKDDEGKLGEILQENLGNRHFLRSIGWDEERWEKVISKQESIFNKKIYLLDFTTISKGVLGLVIQLAFLVTFVWGTLQLHTEAITFGTMSAFLQLVGRIQAPSVLLMSQLPLLIRFRASLDRVMETLSVPVEKNVERFRIPVVDAINLRGVSFGYQGDAVFNDLNLQFRKGEPAALIGSSGKGKTTLLRMIMGLFPSTKGEITLEINKQEVHISNKYRCNFSYVPQGQKLVSGTILYNITGDAIGYSFENLDKAIELACAEFVYDLPQGIKTVVGESGFGLSEGQAQRIGIARAILQDRSIWLFDEVTSALDKPTSERLIQNLFSIGKQKILIFVTHNLSLQSQFKKIYNLK